MTNFDEKTLTNIEGCRVWWDDLGKNGYSAGMTGFHEEVEDFLEIMSPTPKDLEKRRDIVNRISGVIKHVFPTAEIRTYGSYEIGHFLPTSDIDIRVLVDDDGRSMESQYKVLYPIRNELLANNLIMSPQIKEAKKNKVVVLEVKDKITTVKVDIIAKRMTGPQSAGLIRSWFSKWPLAGKLFLVLKQFIVFHQLDGVFHGGLNSYSLIIMIICFLHSVANNFGNRKLGIAKNNLGELLYQFFGYYGYDHDYNMYGLRVTDGGSFFKINIGPNQKRDQLVIENPLERGHNIANGTYRLDNITRAFQLAYDALKRPRDLMWRFFPDNGFLGRIIRVPESTMNIRNRIARDLTAAEIDNILNSEEELARAEAPAEEPIQISNIDYSWMSMYTEEAPENAP